MKSIPGRRLAVAFSGFLYFTLLTSCLLKHREPAEAILRKIPVQSGGRVKPFESFAREALLSVTGKSSLEGESATTVLWQWISQPERWYTKSFLRGEVSPEQALTDPAFQEKAKQTKGIKLYDQARLFQAIAQGSLPGLFPDPEDPRKSWISLAGLADPERRAVLERQYPPSELAGFEPSLAGLVQAFREENRENLSNASRQFAFSFNHLLESRGVLLDQRRIEFELFYHQIRPFQWAWILYLASGIAWFFLRGRFPTLQISFFGLGFAMHTLGFAFRCLIAGRPPVTNMYESIVWVAWAVAFFSILLGAVYKKSVLPACAAGVASCALLIGESFPAVLDPSLSPLVPVLRNNYWLTIHVLTITLSYGAFALAWGIAHANLMRFASHPEKKEENERLHEYLYRALQIGVVLLASGTILGGVWASDSWGRFWGWDPKETWALIALFGYLAVLHGRFAGWLGPFGTALGSILAFLGVLMAWYGVNFVLAAGFHSYGFGGGGLPYVLTAVAIDLIFVSCLAFRYNKNKIRSVLS